MFPSVEREVKEVMEGEAGEEGARLVARLTCPGEGGWKVGERRSKE